MGFFFHKQVYKTSECPTSRRVAACLSVLSVYVASNEIIYTIFLLFAAIGDNFRSAVLSWSTVMGRKIKYILNLVKVTERWKRYNDQM